MSEKDVLSMRWPNSLRLLSVAFGVVVVINFPAVTYIERYAYGLYFYLDFNLIANGTLLVNPG